VLSRLIVDRTNIVQKTSCAERFRTENGVLVVWYYYIGRFSWIY
jgi:hypothetical protein